MKSAMGNKALTEKCILVWKRGNDVKSLVVGTRTLLNFKKRQLMTQPQHGGKLLVMSEKAYKFNLLPSLKK